MTRSRALVAMSGGVDSSVAAALMLEDGYDVIGATMRVFDYSGVSRCGTCCAPDDIADAKRVADRLGIAHYTLDYEDRFEESVIQPFVEEYLRGRTPIPCIACNDRMKFRWMMRRADELGCDVLVTGHYARIDHAGDRTRLLRGAETTRDQTYFLFNLNAAQLRRIRFPVGDMSKTEVRRMAAERDLPVAHKADSQEICFVPGGDYARVIETAAPERIRPGAIVDRAGRVLGTHDGCHRFTVGQRKGLGSFGPEPTYVLAIDAAAARVVVGRGDEAWFRALECRAFHWIGEAPATPTHGWVKVRHQHAGAAATATLTDGVVTIAFDEPVRAVTPGQAAVFYRDDEVLGGGFIDRALFADERS